MTLQTTQMGSADTSTCPATGDVADSAVTSGAESPERMSVGDIRAVSKVMFGRLGVLEEGTPEYAYVRNSLIELNMSLVRFAARRFGNRSEQMEDILQVGTIGLIKAIDRFDADYGVEFVTFAMPTIVGEIKRFFRDTSWSVRVPRRLQELRLSLAKTTDRLEAELGRTPTVAELAEALSIEQEDVLEAMVAANGYSASSLDTEITSEDNSETWAARLGYEDEALEGVENFNALKPLLASLSERERLILSMRFGQEMTQAQIGAELGLSQMHISRLLSRTLRKLRARLLAED